MNHLTSSSYDNFEITFVKELNRYAPLKKKLLRHNNNIFMTKELRKLRPKLKNSFDKKPPILTWKNKSMVVDSRSTWDTFQPKLEKNKNKNKNKIKTPTI